MIGTLHFWWGNSVVPKMKQAVGVWGLGVGFIGFRLVYGLNQRVVTP